jgi:hypothetical protein
MACRVGSYISTILCALLGRSFLFARIDCYHVHVVIACVNDFEAEILTKRDDGLLYGKGRDGVSESGTFCALPRWVLVSGGRWLVGKFFFSFCLFCFLMSCCSEWAGGLGRYRKGSGGECVETGYSITKMKYVGEWCV